MLKAGELEAQAQLQNPYTTFVDEAEGLDKLEQLQTHNNEEVYKKAVSLLEQFFNIEEEDAALAPLQTTEGYTFGVHPGEAPTPVNGFQF